MPADWWRDQLWLRRLGWRAFEIAARKRPNHWIARWAAQARTRMRCAGIVA